LDYPDIINTLTIQHEILLGTAIVLIIALLAWYRVFAGKQYGVQTSWHQNHMVLAQVIILLIVIVLFGAVVWLVNVQLPSH